MSWRYRQVLQWCMSLRERPSQVTSHQGTGRWHAQAASEHRMASSLWHSLWWRAVEVRLAVWRREGGSPLPVCRKISFHDLARIEHKLWSCRAGIEHPGSHMLLHPHSLPSTSRKTSRHSSQPHWAREILEGASRLVASRVLRHAAPDLLYMMPARLVLRHTPPGGAGFEDLLPRWQPRVDGLFPAGRRRERQI